MVLDPYQSPSVAEKCGTLTNSSSASSFSWRVFPPPAAHPRRTKKKQKREHQHKRRSTGNDKDPQSKVEDGGNDHQQQQPLMEPQKEKELWQQKQQQYQYTYPYRVGDPVVAMVSRWRLKQLRHSVERRNNSNGRGIFNGNKTEPTEGDDGRLQGSDVTNIAENLEGSKSESKSSNCFVPVPGYVVKIATTEDKEPSEGIVCAVPNNSGYDAPTKICLSPREQRKRLCPEFSSPTVVLVEETLPFRRLVGFQLHNHRYSGDRVLEIGCSTGELSKLVWKNHSEVPLFPGGAQTILPKRLPSWIGMDNSQEMIDRCGEQLSRHIKKEEESSGVSSSYSSKVVKIDVLDEPERASKEATTPAELFGPSPTVVLIDIGGNRECGPVVKILEWVLEVFGGGRTDGGGGSSDNSSSLRMVIVKSRALFRQLLSDCGNESKNVSNNIHCDNSNNSSDTPGIHASSGIVSGGEQWFTKTHRRLLLEGKTTRSGGCFLFKHPLKAPRVLSPVDGITPICRYHNYHKDGCKQQVENRASGTKKCLLDHDHCHICLRRGHVAMNCPLLHEKE